MKKFLLIEKHFVTSKFWKNLLCEREVGYIVKRAPVGMQVVSDDFILFREIEKSLNGNCCVHLYSYIALNKNNFHKNILNKFIYSKNANNNWYDNLLFNLNREHSIYNKFIDIPYANSLRIFYDTDDETCVNAYLTCFLISENFSLNNFDKFIKSNGINNMEKELIKFSKKSKLYINKDYFSP